MNNRTEFPILLYLYCITYNKPEIKESAGRMDAPYCIKYKDIYAVVSNVSSKDFSEKYIENNISNIEWLEKKVRIHDCTINEIMSGKNITALVPFKFATVFFDENSLKSFLNKYYDSLVATLDSLINKEEWGVKIFYDKKLLEKSILSDDPNVKKFDDEINSSSPGKGYLLKKKKKELVETLLHVKTSEYGKECFVQLKKLSLQTKINKLQSKELTGKDNDMILNAVFLVDIHNISQFTDSVLDLKNRFNPRGFDIEFTGPWPAYNFCKIVENKMGV